MNFKLNILWKLKVCTLAVVIEESFNKYEYLLGVSSDCLVIINRKKDFVEWIVEGYDIDGVVAEADSEDEFLDAIIVIKEMISLGLNPVLWLKNQI